VRDDAVLRILDSIGEITLPDLIKRARHSPAFRTAKAASSMPALNRRRANVLREQVRRTVKRLEGHSAVETELHFGVFGPVIHVRLAHAKRTQNVAAKPQHPSVAPTTTENEPEVPVKVREWISSALASPDLVLEAQPPAQPHRGVVVDRPVRFCDGAYFEVVRPCA
jgi:hypothetical protein